MTRLGRNEISRLGSSVATQPAIASASASLPARSAFSRSTRREYGSRATSQRSWSASSRKISNVSPPTSSVPRVSMSLFHQTDNARRRDRHGGRGTPSSKGASTVREGSSWGEPAVPPHASERSERLTPRRLGHRADRGLQDP